MSDIIKIGNIVPKQTCSIRGIINSLEVLTLFNGNMVAQFQIEDFTDEITCKIFVPIDLQAEFSDSDDLKNGDRVTLTGRALWDGFDDKLTFLVSSVHQ